MRVKNIALVSVCALVAGFLFGCASTRAPSGWLPSADKAQRDAYGAWVFVEYEVGSSEKQTQGEFIAVGPDTLFVLDAEALVAVPLQHIHHAQLSTYDSNYGGLALWTIVGSLTTPSHGYFLLLSLPLWVLTGSISTSAQSWLTIEKFPAMSWDKLRKYARFPQGLPKRLDRSTLKVKLR